ncbi:MAG TPA: biopolymer transporter ExbD [Verrucomicrobiae bacterium]|nr:biopolymer transporter ExbD [Verrucomicrobiae bacterium]
MKLKRRKVKRGRVEIIPMVDTIVILLIFYMTFSRFAEATREANLKLPVSRAGDEFKQLPQQVIINMYSADDITINKRHYKVADLPGFLSALRQSDPKYERMSIILRGNRDMTYKDLSDFMTACAAAKITDATFTTLDKR